MYECVICKTLNHASRLHCHVCGTVPAMYSFFRKPISFSSDGNMFHEVVTAHGAIRASEHKAQRVNLRTVALDYYAE